MTIAAVHQYIDEHFEEHLAVTKEFVRQPSISADGTGMAETAQLLVDKIQAIGGTSEIVPTPGYPVVYGEINVGAPRTILIYGMYDVQPVVGETWMAPPFAAEIVGLPELGPSMVSRGTMNSKGPLIGTLLAIDALRKTTGTLPVNLLFLIEGEEELGSKHLPIAVDTLAERLKQADVAFFPFYSQNPKGKVVMSLGMKGLVFLELTVRGGAWGGPTTRDVHASQASWFSSPTWILVHALSTLLSHDQQRILVEGLYDRVTGPDEDDEALLRKLEATFDEEVIRKEFDLNRFKYDLAGVDLLRRYMFDPSLNIDGLVSGHHAEGSKTVLPHIARAKIHLRPVPNMRPQEVVDQIRNHLDRNGFPQVEMDVHTAYPPYKSSVRDPGNQAMIAAYRSLGHEPEIWPLRAGAAPTYLFKEKLGIELTLGGLGHGARQHSPNEYATVEGMRLYEKSVVSFFHHFANFEQ